MNILFYQYYKRLQNHIIYFPPSPRIALFSKKVLILSPQSVIIIKWMNRIIPLIIFLKFQKAYITKHHKLLPLLQAWKMSAILSLLIWCHAYVTFTEIIFSSSIIFSFIQGASFFLFNKKYRKGLKVFVKMALVTLLCSSVLSREELYCNFHIVEMQMACFKAYCICFSK